MSQRANHRSKPKSASAQNLAFAAASAFLSLLSNDAWAQTAVPPPNSRMLVEVTDISGIAISPDGESVAYRTERASIERNTYDSVWNVRPLNDEHALPLQIADGGVPLRDGGQVVVEAAQWSPDSAWIYYRALLDDGIQVWRAARDGNKAEPVTSDAADVDRFMLDEAGRTIIYEVGAERSEIERAEREEFDRGIRIDGSIHTLEGLYRATFSNDRMISRRTDDMNRNRRLLSERPKRYFAVDLKTRDRRAATAEEVQRFQRPASPITTRQSVAFGPLTADLSGRKPASELAVRGSDPNRVVVCGPCRALTIEGVVWRSRDEIIFTARRKDLGFAQALYSWRVSTDELREIVASDGLLGGDRTGLGSTCAVYSDLAVCVTASALIPPRLERIDLESGERRILADPNERLGQASRAIASEFLTWKDAQGREFTGHLLLPANRREGERLPLFVTYYICPGYLRGGHGDEWPLQPMAASGIAALCINGRLPAGPGRDAAADYAAGTAGVEAAVDLLADRGIIDRSRVGMGALSFGTEVTMWTAGHTDLLAAASVANPSVTPMWYWLNAARRGFAENAMVQWRLGPPGETPERWAELSPIHFVDRIKAPLLMQLPESEYRPALDYFGQMKRAGQPVEFWVFPHETHAKYLPRHKVAAYERNLDWFRFWLQDYVDPDPLKSDQYRRWSAFKSDVQR